ncbi:hypothetical protein [Methanoregula sp.]|uniref:hypothetical protein n=1 Tax=Methanoregula sp. TaxID=2052170 RepID=UPI000CC4E778|nr:hypothetical protein [Methanoregula sp.]PKG33495.1 MAG: hypothetical protein CW742_02645 [Methanoregula sp.]
MDTPGSESGDAVIHRTQRLIINGIGYEAVFLEGQLTLVCEDAGKPRLEIPYQDITLASAETNRLREPVIRITYGTSDGSMRGIELIFIFLAAGRNIQNRDRCLTVLEKQGVAVQADPTPADYYSRAKRERMDAGTLDSDAPTGRPAVPEWTVYGPAQGTRQAIPDEPKPISPAFTLLAIVLLMAILVLAMVSPIPEPGLQPWEKAAAAKAGVTAAPTPVNVPTPAATPAPVPGEKPPLSGTVPGNGIWVKISYPGQYSGFLSASGWRSDVNSSGTQWYQLPVQNTVIDGFIEKGDGSMERLEVATYNGGVLIARHETTTPRGIVEMHVSVGPAVAGPDATVPATPVAAEPTPPGEGPVRLAIPDNGVWVQVRYPGNYTGTISSNGQVRSVEGAGDQIYQMVMKSGTIDGILEKEDGSRDLLEVLVYKDGVLTALANTTVPRGIAEVHTTV